jgi:hypothetical protein
MTDLFAAPQPYPESVLLSIYNAYPRKTGRPAALKRTAEALDRICQGEIDGSPRTQAEAIEFLRVKVEEARRQMGAREQKFIPHMATWLNGRRYLRLELAAIEKPKQLEVCAEILCLYPTSPKLLDIYANLDAFMPALAAIDKALDRIGAQEWNQMAIPQSPIRYLEARTRTYAMAVKQWPVEDLKYVPNPVKWFGEARYEQPEQSWQRQPVNDYISEREQLSRVLNGRTQTGNGSGRPN